LSRQKANPELEEKISPSVCHATPRGMEGLPSPFSGSNGE
jgi:hypothetical protein